MSGKWISSDMKPISNFAKRKQEQIQNFIKNMKKHKYRIIPESEYVIIHTFGEPDKIIIQK